MDESGTDANDPREKWCAERRQQVLDYLDAAQLVRGDLADIPAWLIYPYVSLWAVESHRTPGYIGWWVICGDCPTDYVTATPDQSARSGLRAIAAQWQSAVAYLERGEQHPDFTMGDAGDARTLSPLLEARAAALIKLADDDELWEPASQPDAQFGP